MPRLRRLRADRDQAGAVDVHRTPRPWTSLVQRLRWAHFGHGAVEATAGEFSHALRVHNVTLVLGEFLEHWQLVGFLEAAQTHAHRAGFRRHDHDGAVCPESGSDTCHAVGDAWAVLADHQTVAAGDACIAVSHVGCALLVNHGDQADAGWCEDIHRVHECRTHDAEHLGHAIGHTCFNECFGRRHFLNALRNLTIVYFSCSHLCLLRKKI